MEWLWKGRLPVGCGMVLSGPVACNKSNAAIAFAACVHANVRLLRRLGAADLEKFARHPERDHSVTVADYVGMMSKHGPNHLEQIERLKKEATGK